MSRSVRRAAEKVESISAGRRGGGPPKKPMAFCASRESSASLSGSPPVPAEAEAWEVGGQGGEARLATLLAFVYDREPYFSLKLPSRLKSLCRTVNGAKAPSSLVHTGTGPARLQVGWLSCLVFAFFFLSSVVWTHCPVTCCLDPFFHLHKFFHLLPPF